MTSQSIIKTVADTIHANGNGKIPSEVVSDPRHSLHWGKCLFAASEEVLS